MFPERVPIGVWDATHGSTTKFHVPDGTDGRVICWEVVFPLKYTRIVDHESPQKTNWAPAAGHVIASL